MKNKAHTFGMKLITAMTALMLPLCFTACEMPPAQPKTTLLDIHPTAQPGDEETAGTGADKPTAETPVGALIHRVDLPLDVSLDSSWAVVDESAVPLRTRGMWQANGLRIGVLSAQDARTFAEALPNIHGESRAKLIGTPYPTSVRIAPRLLQPVTIDLTDPPKSTQLVQAHGGRLQLLAKITRDETGQAYLELTPHHYKPKVDLVPRSPLEKQLDGTVYTPLTARLPLTPNTAVVVGLYRPWPEPKEAEESSGSANDPSEVVDEVADGAEATTESSDTTTMQDAPAPSSSDQPSAIADPPSAPPIPDHLGKALMAGRRAGYEIQVIMVISIIEDL
jgi:hypothetical protein